MIKKQLVIPLQELSQMEIVCPNCRSSFVLDVTAKTVRTPTNCPGCGQWNRAQIATITYLFDSYSKFFHEGKDVEVLFRVEITRRKDAQSPSSASA